MYMIHLQQHGFEIRLKSEDNVLDIFGRFALVVLKKLYR